MTKIKMQLTVLICRTVMVAIVKLFLWTTQTGCNQLSNNIGNGKEKNRQGWRLFGKKDTKKHKINEKLEKIAENVTSISDDNNIVFEWNNGKLYKVTLRTKKDANNYYTTNSDTYSIFLSENSGELHSTSSRVTTDESLNNASCKEMKVEYVEANTLLNISEEQPCQEPLFNSQDQQKNINALDELANSLKEL